MIESIMFFAGGFLVAGLLALALISSVHHRAVRLTQRRLQDALPVSLTEIQADRDKLRAKFAMSARRLEMTVEQLDRRAILVGNDGTPVGARILIDDRHPILAHVPRELVGALVFLAPQCLEVSRKPFVEPCVRPIAASQ